jgi:hypothetical protein
MISSAKTSSEVLRLILNVDVKIEYHVCQDHDLLRELVRIASGHYLSLVITQV